MEKQFPNRVGLEPEQIRLIMEHLGFEDIFEMRLVSKSWYNSIMDDEFINYHTKEQKVSFMYFFCLLKLSNKFDSMNFFPLCRQMFLM